MREGKEFRNFYGEAEWMTRHKHENRVASNGSNRGMNRVPLFSKYIPTADLTAITQKSAVLVFLLSWDGIIFLS